MSFEDIPKDSILGEFLSELEPSLKEMPDAAADFARCLATTALFFEVYEIYLRKLRDKGNKEE